MFAAHYDCANAAGPLFVLESGIEEEIHHYNSHAAKEKQKTLKTYAAWWESKLHFLVSDADVGHELAAGDLTGTLFAVGLFPQLIWEDSRGPLVAACYNHSLACRWAQEAPSRT